MGQEGKQDSDGAASVDDLLKNRVDVNCNLFF